MILRMLGTTPNPMWGFGLLRAAVAMMGSQPLGCEWGWAFEVPQKLREESGATGALQSVPVPLLQSEEGVCSGPVSSERLMFGAERVGIITMICCSGSSSGSGYQYHCRRCHTENSCRGLSLKCRLLRAALDFHGRWFCEQSLGSRPMKQIPLLETSGIIATKRD